MVAAPIVEDLPHCALGSWVAGAEPLASVSSCVGGGGEVGDNRESDKQPRSRRGCDASAPCPAGAQVTVMGPSTHTGQWDPKEKPDSRTGSAEHGSGCQGWAGGWGGGNDFSREVREVRGSGDRGWRHYVVSVELAERELTCSHTHMTNTRGAGAERGLLHPFHVSACIRPPCASPVPYRFVSRH